MKAKKYSALKKLAKRTDETTREERKQLVEEPISKPLKPNPREGTDADTIWLAKLVARLKRFRHSFN